MERKCLACKEVKPIDQFRQFLGKYYSHTCKSCHTKRSYHKKSERLDEYNEQRRMNNRRIKYEVFRAYGGKCVCCGENNLGFLSLDHINGGGNAHRRELSGSLKAGSGFYRWVQREGHPDFLRLMCYNCNLGRHQNNGICPHVKPDELISKLENKPKIKRSAEVIERQRAGLKLAWEKRERVDRPKKLAREDVVAIRALEGVSVNDIARAYKVTHTVIGKILRRELWKHV